MNVNVVVFKPIDTRVNTFPHYSEPAKMIRFVASCVDFPEDYVDSVTLTTSEATKPNAKAAIKAKIIDHVEQNVTPWQEYTETI